MSGLAQAAGGAGGLIGLAATKTPSNPYGSTAKTAKQLGNTVMPIEAGGLKIGFNEPNRTFYASSTPERQGLVNALSGVYGNTAKELSGLRSQVTPGFGRLTEAGVQALNNTRQRTISNLTDELGRRRVLGSSFGADTIARAERELGDTEAQYRAQAFLAELTANLDVLRQESQNLVAEQTTKLNELNLQADLAYKMGTGLNSGIQQLSGAMEQMMFEDQVNRNGAMISGISNIFGGLTSAGVAAATFGLSDFATGGYQGTNTGYSGTTASAPSGQTRGFANGMYGGGV